MNANCHPLKPEVENITSTEGSHAPPASVTVIPALPSLLSATPLGLHRSTEQWSEGFRSVPLLFSGVQDLTCPLPASSSTGCPQQLGVRITNQAPSTTPGSSSCSLNTGCYCLEMIMLRANLSTIMKLVLVPGS